MANSRTSTQLLAMLPELDVNRIAETLVAFSNSDGGTLVLGYDERGKEMLHIEPEDVENALRNAAELCRPTVRAYLEQADYSTGGPSLVIRVPRSNELHTMSDGRTLVRQGGENRPLHGDEIRHLAASKTTEDYELEVAPGATLDDLDPNMITEYVAKREDRTRRKVMIEPRQLLHDVGAINAHGQPTVAGILLFGRNPQAFMPQSGLVFVKFPGTEPRADGGAFGYGRREEINGPLARVIETSWRVVLEEMRVGAVVTGLERQEVMEYPEYAVREALVNAVCHRDYRTRGRRIEIRKFSDRMEIISPGGLAGYITLDNIIEEHFSRNPRLVQGLFQWGYIEELGLGIDRMIEEMTAYGQPAPKFNATSYSFTVTLSNHRERRGHFGLLQPVSTADGLTVNERQARALQYIRDHSRITNRDYQNLCPDVTPETLRTDLADMVDKGVLMRIGEKKGTYYILK